MVATAGRWTNVCGPLTHALENNSNGRFCYMYFTVIKKMGEKVAHDLLSVTQGVNAGVQI